MTGLLVIDPQFGARLALLLKRGLDGYRAYCRVGGVPSARPPAGRQPAVPLHCRVVTLNVAIVVILSVAQQELRTAGRARANRMPGEDD